LKRSNRLVLLIGIFLAIIAFVLVVFTMQPTKQDIGDPTLREVAIVVAAKDIPLGTLIQADDLTTTNVVERDKPADSFTAAASVIGQTARANVATGQLITSAVLGTNSSTGLTHIDCPTTFVCMAVQVDQVSGVGTLTQAGDFVDMVVGFTADKFPVVTVNPDDATITTVAGVNGTSVKALLQGVQVVGTLLPPPPADTGTTDPNASPAAGNETVLNGQQQIVILALTTQQSEVVKFGQLDGSISLVLRSGDDFRDPLTGDLLPANTVVPVATTGITLKTLVDEYGVLVPELVELVLPEQPER
jgi:Flp pilus assembly protein CpaB